MDILFLNEYRCKCGKLLLKSIFFDGFLEIKCKHCGEMNKMGRSKKEDENKRYILIINDQGKIINASDSACSILGYKAEEIIGQHFDKINTTISEEMEKTFIGPESILNEENCFQLDTFHQTKNSYKIPVMVLLKTYYPKEKEKCILVLSEVKDKIEEKSQNNCQISKFFDNTCDFYFDMDANGMGEYACPSVEKIFGFPPEAIVGKNFFDYLSVETKINFKETFDHFSAIKQPFRSLHSVGPDIHGQPIHTELYFTSKFDDNGKFVGYRVLGWVLKNTQSR